MECGTLIQNTKHPEWGTFVVKSTTHLDGSYWYNIRNRAGERVLFPEEMEKEWIITHTAKVAQELLMARRISKL